MKRQFIGFIALAALLFGPSRLMAQEFEHYFSDPTLRIDYTLMGNASEQHAALKELQHYPEWSGRRHNLSTSPLRGNGQVILRDKVSGEVIYRQAFSSLFQEWIVTPEAREVSRSFEATFLVPMPLQEAEVELVLMNNRGEEQCSLKHTIHPDDVLIRDLSAVEPQPHEYLHRGGSDEACIDVCILAEGYTEAEMELFLEDARRAAEEILRYAPFSGYRERFNFIAVKSPSKHANVSVPQDDQWRETAINSNFMTFYMPRYLTTSNVYALYDQVRNIPCEHLVVLANTETYGGGGIYNSYTLTTAHHPHFKPVVVHEFGHSFGGLGDEYFYDTEDATDETYSLAHEPWEPNITTGVDFDSKWADLMPEGVERPTLPTDQRKADYTVGLYEGGGYRTKGIFRPAVVCRMRDNVADRFCPVCERNLERVILHQTEPEK